LKKYLILALWLATVLPSFAMQEKPEKLLVKAFLVYKEEYKGAALRQKVDSLIAVSNETENLREKEEIGFIFAIDNAIAGEFQWAITYGKIGLEALSIRDPNSDNYFGLTLNVGRFHMDNRQYAEAITYFEEVINNSENTALVAMAYSELGWCYLSAGDYYKSADFYEKGFELLLEIGDYVSLIVYTTNVVVAYDKINTPESLLKREKVLLRADSLLSVTKVDRPNYMRLKNAVANLYTSEGFYDFGKARNIYLDNLKIGGAEGDTLTLSMSYNNLAYLYNLEERDSAAYWANKGLQIVKSTEQHARLNDNLSDFYLFRDDFTEALNFMHKAMETSLDTQLPISQPPTAVQLNASDFKDYVMYCLNRKSEIYNKLYQQTKDCLLYTSDAADA